MIVKRVKDIWLVEVVSTTLQSQKFNMEVVEREAKEKADILVKMEVILKAYNEGKVELAHKDKIIAKLKGQIEGPQEKGESSTLIIVSTPTTSPSIVPIIEFPPSPRTSGFQSSKTPWDEMEKLKQAQVVFASKYEEKFRGTILKFADTIGASIMYIYEKIFKHVDGSEERQGYSRANFK